MPGSTGNVNNNQKGMNVRKKIKVSDLTDRLDNVEERLDGLEMISHFLSIGISSGYRTPQEQKNIAEAATSNHAPDLEPEPPSLWFFEGRFWLKDQRIYNGDPFPGPDDVVMSESDPGTLVRGPETELPGVGCWIMREAEEFSAEGQPGFLDGDLIESGEFRPARRGSGDGERDWFLEEGSLFGFDFKQPLYNTADPLTRQKILIPRDEAMARAINVETDWEARCYEQQQEIHRLQDERNIAQDKAVALKSELDKMERSRDHFKNRLANLHYKIRLDALDDVETD